MAIIMAPLIKLVHLINRPFEIKEDDSQPTAAAEIAALASLARREKEISSQQERILLATPKLSERRADEIMLPVENISFVSSDLTPAEALNAAPADFPRTRVSEKIRNGEKITNSELRRTLAQMCEGGNPDQEG